MFEGETLPVVEMSDGIGSKTFTFHLDRDVWKAILLTRAGRQVSVETRYAGFSLSEHVMDAFEADGPIAIAETDSGIYVTSSRLVLKDGLRLKRTRFF